MCFTGSKVLEQHRVTARIKELGGRKITAAKLAQDVIKLMHEVGLMEISEGVAGAVAGTLAVPAEPVREALGKQLQKALHFDVKDSEKLSQCWAGRAINESFPVAACPEILRRVGLLS